jgi:hypothetical protein
MISFVIDPLEGSGMDMCPSTHGSKMIIPVGNALVFENIRIANFSNVVGDRIELSPM